MKSLALMHAAVQKAATRTALSALGVSLAAFAAGGLAPAQAQAATPSYTITDLGNLGYPSSFPTGVNASGQVSGDSYLQTTIPGPCPPKHPCKEHLERAFSFSGATMTNLGTLGGNFSYGQAINTAGSVAGFSTLAGLTTTHAFLETGGTMTDLGTLSGTGSSRAFAINDSGQVAGWSTTAADAQHAFLYSNGTMTDLGTLGSNLSYASGINNAGQVVGSSDLAGGQDTHAFLYSGGKLTDLGTLGGPNSTAFAINTAGQVVGWAQTGSDATHAFLYTGGKMTDLGAYNIDTVAEAINNSGVIVGQTYGTDSTGSPFYHAFIHTSSGFQDLNSLIPAGSGYELTDAAGINDSGQIIATAYNTTNGQNHAFLLSPS